jgi:hypothetical protein
MKKTEYKELWQEAIEAAYREDYKAALQLLEEARPYFATEADYAIEKAEIMCEIPDYDGALAVLSAKEIAALPQVQAEVKKLKEELAQDNILPPGAITQQAMGRVRGEEGN